MLILSGIIVPIHNLTYSKTFTLKFSVNMPAVGPVCLYFRLFLFFFVFFFFFFYQYSYLRLLLRFLSLYKLRFLFCLVFSLKNKKSSVCLSVCLCLSLSLPLFSSPSMELLLVAWIKCDRLRRTSSVFVPLTSCPFLFNRTFKSKVFIELNDRAVEWPPLLNGSKRCPSLQRAILVPNSRLTSGNGLLGFLIIVFNNICR